MGPHPTENFKVHTYYSNFHSKKEWKIIFISFLEEFENDIPRTVKSVLCGLPDIEIIVISKKNPYPPLELPEENVKV